MQSSWRALQVVVTVAATATLAVILIHARQPRSASRIEPGMRAEITKRSAGTGLNIGVGACTDQPVKVQPVVNAAYARSSCSGPADPKMQMEPISDPVLPELAESEPRQDVMMKGAALELQAF